MTPTSSTRRVSYYIGLFVAGIVLAGITAVFVSVLFESNATVSGGSAVAMALFFFVCWDLFLHGLKKVFSARAIEWVDPTPASDPKLAASIVKTGQRSVRSSLFAVFFITMIAAIVFGVYVLTRTQAVYSLTSVSIVFIATGICYILLRLLLSKFFPGIKMFGVQVSFTTKDDRIIFEFPYVDFKKRGMSSVFREVLFSEVSEITAFQNPIDAYTYFETYLRSNSDFWQKNMPANFHFYDPDFKLTYYTNGGMGGRGRGGGGGGFMAPALLLKGPSLLLFIFLNKDARCADAVLAFEQYKRLHSHL